MDVFDSVALAAEDVLESLTRVVHPAYGISIVDLGLVYGIEVTPARTTIQMTLPDPGRSGDDDLVARIHEVLRRRHPTIGPIRVDLVWDPPWREDFITPEGQLQLRAPITGVEPDAPGTAREEELLASLALVLDPEVGINIVDLGLVYGVALDGTAVRVTMTLTTPGCPLHASIEMAVRRVLETRHPWLTDVGVDLVWDPPWDTDRITPAGRAQLGW